MIFRLIDRVMENTRKKQLTWVSDEILDATERIIDDASSELMDKLLCLGLKAVSLMFKLDREFRENIKEFRAVYSFASSDGILGVSATFRKSYVFRMPVMKVSSRLKRNHTVKVTFANGRAMAGFLFSEDPDIISGLIDNTLSIDGNMNYILKFIYMVTQIPEYLGIREHPALVRILERE